MTPETECEAFNCVMFASRSVDGSDYCGPHARLIAEAHGRKIADLEDSP